MALEKIMLLLACIFVALKLLGMSFITIVFAGPLGLKIPICYRTLRAPVSEERLMMHDTGI